MKKRLWRFGCYGAFLAVLLPLVFTTGCGKAGTVTDREPASEAVLSEDMPPEESAEPGDAPPEEHAEPGNAVSESMAEEEAPEDTETLDPEGSYTTAEDVSLYLVLYGELPQNFITKKEAQALGWPGGTLEPYAPGKCIGGDRFGNYEELLPEDREYHECDIDTLGAESRGAKRLVFSDDGLIYYTEDHYESFTLLYGEE